MDTLRKPDVLARNSRGMERKKRLRNLGPASFFVLPGLLLAAAFVIYPMLFNIRISFSEYNIVQRTITWTGLNNLSALLNDSQGRLLVAIRNNYLYALVTTPFILLFGVLFAVMINNLRHARILFRTFFYLPVITSWVIVGMVFTYMFNSSERGLINYLLVDFLHVQDSYIPWLRRTWTANSVIWIMGIWKNVGWAMIIYLAGLQSISPQLYEAADIEGAGSAAKLWYITIPLLKNTTYYVMVNMLIGSFNVFLQVLLLTNGDPRGTTSVLQFLLYDKAFNQFVFGQGAAVGLITAVLILFTTTVVNRIFKTGGGRT